MRPLTHGSVLIVGAKASNFDSSVRDNPRVILWDSQDKCWNGKEVPQNVQAIFFTRWIGHPEYDCIMADARKRRITVFQPIGTGMITKQVKELLNVNNRTNPVDSVSTNHILVTNPMPLKNKNYNKLLPIKALIDVNKSAKDNADIMLAKAQELGIKTSLKSLQQIAYAERKKAGVTTRRVVLPPKKFQKYEGTPDVTVEIFDNIVKELTDMRQFLISTVEENHILRARIAKFKKSLETDD